MPLTIVVTPGSPTANSYADEAQFIAYAATRLAVPAGTTVSGSACTEREKIALIEASRELTLLEGTWAGQRSTLEQALAWPRQFVINPDAPEVVGVSDIALLYFGTDVVPSRVVEATCQLALELLASSRDLTTLDESLAVTREVVDVLETDYVAPEKRAQGLARFPRVLNLLAPLFAAGDTGGLTLVRC